MTEAAHQIASNPLPPDVRKPGTVGRATGLEVAILGGSDTPLPAGEIGEVAIRGPAPVLGVRGESRGERSGVHRRLVPNRRRGFARRRRLPHSARSDQGDHQPRRGEDLPAGGRRCAAAARSRAAGRDVRGADARLGEEIAAAVVLAPGADADERRSRTSSRRSSRPSRCPAGVVVLDEIPKGPTGKVQRLGLADRLGVAASTRRRARPATATGFLETDLVEIWKSVLGRRDVGVADDFFALGGDSILGAEAVARVRNHVGDPDIPLASIVRAPTPAAMAREVFGGVGSGTWGAIPLRSAGSRAPLFLVHPGDGDVLAFAMLARRLGADQPTYGLRARGHRRRDASSLDARRDGGRLRRFAIRERAAARAVRPRRVLHGRPGGRRDGTSAGRRGRGGGDARPARSPLPAARWSPLPRMACAERPWTRPGAVPDEASVSPGVGRANGSWQGR